MNKEFKVYKLEDLQNIEEKISGRINKVEETIDKSDVIKINPMKSFKNLFSSIKFKTKGIFHNMSDREVKIFKKVTILILLLLDMGVLFFVTYPTVGRYINRDRVKGRLEYEGILKTYDLSHKSYNEIVSIIEGDFAEYQKRSVVLKLPQSDKEYTVDASLIGIEYKKAKVLDEIKSYNNKLSNTDYIYKTLFVKGKIDIGLDVNRAKTELYLQHIYDEIKLEPKNASVEIDGVNILVKPAILGQKMDISKSVEAIKNNLSSVLFTPLTLETEIVEVPALTTESANETKNILSRFYNYPIIIKGDNSNIEETIEVQDILSSIKIIPNINEKRFNVVLNNITSITKKIVDGTKQDGEIPKITLMNGIYQVTDRGTPSIIINQEDLDKKFAMKIKQIIDGEILGQGYNPYIFVKTDIKEYNVGTIRWSEYKMVELKSTFDSSQYSNIEKAIPNINSLVFNPGQTTSLLNVVGGLNYEPVKDIDGANKVGGGLSILGTGIVRTSDFADGMIVNYKKLLGVDKYTMFSPNGIYAEFIPNKADIELLSLKDSYFRYSVSIAKNFKNNNAVTGNNLPIIVKKVVQVNNGGTPEDIEITLFKINSLKAIQQSGIGDIKLEWDYSCGVDELGDNIMCDGLVGTKIIAKDIFGNEKIYNTYNKNILIPSEFNNIWNIDIEFSFTHNDQVYRGNTKIENIRSNEQWQVVTVKLFKFSPFKN